MNDRLIDSAKPLHYLQRDKRKRHIEKALLVLADSTVFSIAFFTGHLSNWLPQKAVYSSYSDWWSLTGQNILLFYSLLSLVAIARFANLGHYTRRRPFWDELRDTWRTILVFAAADAIAMFLTKSQFSRLGFMLSWLFAMILLPIFRTLVKKLLLKAGLWQRRTVIIGTGEGASEAVAAFEGEALMGFEVIALIAPSPVSAELVIGEGEKRVIPVFPLEENLLSLLDMLGAAQIILTFEANEWLQQKHLVQRLYRYFPDVHLIPSNYGLPLCGVEIGHFFRHEILLLTIRNNLGRPGPRIIKRAFDIIASSLLLLALSPLFLTLILKIRKNGGSAFFAHQRVGRNGQLFACYKFRTMSHNADTLLADLLSRDEEARIEWEKHRKLKNDPRITPIGNFLRLSSLDELPQLWNVLKGDMSLVGPRPVTAQEMDYYGDQADFYLETRPGLTGVWQISGRNDISYARRVYLDTWYAKNWSFWYDLVILIKTTKVVLNRGGAY